jgi:hypothetical protein
MIARSLALIQEAPKAPAMKNTDFAVEWAMVDIATPPERDISRDVIGKHRATSLRAYRGGVVVVVEVCKLIFHYPRGNYCGRIKSK